ncbi:RHS repeat protein [Bacteroides heparinolyticus]|uniref:RHS repeat protein n=2 Tax=Prevotella heparinolytica TaxID=28113 RepID=UPI0035A0B6B4
MPYCTTYTTCTCTPRDPDAWSGGFTGRPMFDRGFTGHEHLYGFGLINMNGRMYDPVMSGFLSPDNYIQSPDFSQSFNRYAYCLNNPLKYVDPDGEFWHIVIGAAIGGTVNVLANLKAIDGDFGKGAAYFGIGALAGGLSAGIAGGVGVAYCGESFAAGFLGTTVQAAPSALGFAGGFCVGGSSGLTAGLITGSGNAWMQGAGFGQGLWTGVKTGALGGLVGGAAYGLVGTFSAAIKGNDPWTGAHYNDVTWVNRKMPIVRQNGKNNCMGAATESMSRHKGDNPVITQDDVRGWFPDNPDGPLEDINTLSKYQEVTGRYVTNEELNTITFERIRDDMMFNPNSDYMISRKLLGQTIGHEVNINKVIDRSYRGLFGRVRTEQLYEVVDPYYGDYRLITHDELLKSYNLFKIK